MKKILLFMMALMPFMVSCEKEQIADDSSNNGAIVDYGDYFDGKLYYQIDNTALKLNSHYVSVIRCEKTVKSVSIPLKVKIKGITYECRNIGSEAFAGCTELTSVTIPNSVTSIEMAAFANCTGLTSITIPKNTTLIEPNPFHGCSNITSIIVEDGNSVYDSRRNCNAIIETATNTLITGCKSTVIPNGVTNIGELAFYDCTGLTYITIPNSITSIGSSAFNGCTGLTSIDIPKNVTKIGESSFINCNNVSSIIVDDGNSSYDSRDNCNAIIETATNTLIVGCKNTVIPSSVSTVNIYAFNGCDGLTAIIIPTSVTKINYRPTVSSVRDLGRSDLTTIIVEEGNSVYDSRNNCNAIIETATNTLIVGCKNTVIPNSVEKIESYSFWGCIDLTSISIPNSVTGINYNAFWGCTGLTSISIPNSVTNISNSAFSGCTGLISIAVEDNNSVYDSRGKCNAIIETATNTLFLGCKNTVIPNDVTSIGRNAFQGCTGLTSINIPNSVTDIGVLAFYGCTSLTSVTIPNSVTSIGAGAFRNCTSLSSITIPNDVTYIGGGAFDYTPWLNNQPNGLIYAGLFAYRYKGKMPDGTAIVIKDGTKGLVSNVFANCTGLTSITIPNSVTSIGGTAFANCTALSSISIPNSVTSIEQDAFTYCIALTSITIPNSVTSIEGYAFYGCTGLTSITIPNSVTRIGGRAFCGCTGLKKVICKCDAPPSCLDFPFDDVSSLSLFVPKGSKNAYLNSWAWKDFKEIIEQEL